MDLAPKHYLLIYALIVTPIAISFFFLRRERNPTKLNLTNKNEPSDPSVSTSSAEQLGANPKKPTEERRREPRGEAHQRRAAPPPPPPRSSGGRETSTAPEATERSLNVFFQWNGHTWDAYEALGVPAGSSREAVVAAYQKAVSQSDSESLLFFKAAYEAITRSHT